MLLKKAMESCKKSGDDLAKVLAELRDSVRNLRFKIAAKEVKNHQEMRMVKKDIARILTVLREREK